MWEIVLQIEIWMDGWMVVKPVPLVNTVILLHLHFLPGSFKRDAMKPKRER